MLSNQNLSAYLKRVHLDSVPEVSRSFLFQLHHAQHRSIPFENFDIPLYGHLDLSPDKVFEKLVQQSRGGYCFEVNGLLLRVLQTIGFQARPLLGRVHLSDRLSGRSHQVSLVTLDNQQWLVDAGFGSQTPRAPLPLVLNQEIKTDMQTFRFVEIEHFGTQLQLKEQQTWLDLYSLDFSHVCEGDIAYGNHYTSTHPDSFFTQSQIAAIPIDNGIVTLLDGTFKRLQNGQTDTWRPLDAQSYRTEIERMFGIKLKTLLTLPEK